MTQRDELLALAADASDCFCWMLSPGKRGMHHNIPHGHIESVMRLVAAVNDYIAAQPLLSQAPSDVSNAGVTQPVGLPELPGLPNAMPPLPQCVSRLKLNDAPLFDAFQVHQYAVTYAAQAAGADASGRLRSLRDELQADIDRPDGRWGMHGHAAVDDDYFLALEYVVKRIDAISEQAGAEG